MNAPNTPEEKITPNRVTVEGANKPAPLVVRKPQPPKVVYIGKAPKLSRSPNGSAI